MARWGTDERILLCIMDFLQVLLGLVYSNILNMGSMVGYFALKTPLKMRLTQKTRRLFIFPGISHFEGIGQGGISRDIPPGKYRPGISRTTLLLEVGKAYLSPCYFLE